VLLLQVMLSFGTGAPIFVLFPLLIHAPKVWNSLRSRIKRLIQLIKPRDTRLEPVADDSAVQHCVFSDFQGSMAQIEFERSLYWRHRFYFAVFLWMSFVSYISAEFAMQALPIPGFACMLTDDNQWILKADPNFVCFSVEMLRSHLLGVILALVFTVLFPFVLYSKIRIISVLNKWDDEAYVFQIGYFYDPFKKNWCYVWILNHMQLCVLATALNVAFSLDEMAMVIAPIILHVVYLAVVAFGQPFESRLDNILEAVVIVTNTYGFGLSLLLTQDPQNVAIHVRIMTRHAESVGACAI
jgi:hypothetical protein